jgi:hypothetical protein
MVMIIYITYILFFIGCASVNKAGGAVWVVNFIVSVIRSTFTNDYSITNGGVFDCAGAGSVTISFCTFINDKSNNERGGVYFSNSEDLSLVLFDECNFTNCSAEMNSGALGIFRPSNATVSRCIFLNCSGGDNGLFYYPVNYFYFILFFFI